MYLLFKHILFAYKLRMTLDTSYVTIELILAGDENLTPNQNIEIFSAVYSFIRSTQRFN
jgi:hypothetical protein